MDFDAGIHGFIMLYHFQHIHAIPYISFIRSWVAQFPSHGHHRTIIFLRRFCPKPRTTPTAAIVSAAGGTSDLQGSNGRMAIDSETFAASFQCQTFAALWIHLRNAFPREALGVLNLLNSGVLVVKSPK